MEFEWNPEKATENLKKHRVTFQEAATIFGDPLAITFYDPDHSINENRYITFGMSLQKRLIVASHTERRGKTRIISARLMDRKERKSMRKANTPDELRPAYSREDLGEGVRGKYFESYQKGTNLVLLSPDVAKVFSTEDAVNEALRSLINLAQKSTGRTRR